MDSEESSTILPALTRLSILRMLWKRKFLIGMVWFAVSIATYFVVQRIPAVYTANALVVVSSQKIPDRYVSSTIVSDAQDRLATLSLEILSNKRLEEIVEHFDLYREQRRMFPIEKTLDLMRADIKVLPEAGHTASFRVGYQGPDPVVVANVANWIANIYVEENARSRETQAVGTSEFMDSKLKEAKEKLDQLEAMVSQYKTRHNGELPQQEATLNGALNRLQVELEANRDALNRAQQSKMTLQDAITIAEDSARIQTRELRLAASMASAGSMAGGAGPRPLSRLEALQTQLADLQLRGHTDASPDVKRLRTQIEQIKQVQPKELVGAPGETGAKPGVSTAAEMALESSPELLQARARIASLKSQLAVADQDLKTREADQRRILGNISLYQGKIGGLPIREQEMSQITRDYEFSKINYQSLLDKKLNATMAAEMEMKQKSERFTVADPAMIPTSPFKPKRMLLDAGGTILGLILGLVLGVGKELQKGLLLGEWELPADVTVLGRLPHIDSPPNASMSDDIAEDKPGNPKRKAAFLASGTVVIVVAAGIYLMEHGLNHVSRVLWIK